MQTLEPIIPTPKEIEKNFRAMNDSVLVIDCDKTSLPLERQPKTNQDIDRNVRHLEFMLDKSYIQDDGRPLDIYEEAIVNGTAYIAAHGGLTPTGIIG